MIDFSKFGFTIKEEDDEAALYTSNTWLEMQHWKKPDIFLIHVSRDKILKLKTQEDFAKETEGMSDRDALGYMKKVKEEIIKGNTAVAYKIKDNITDSERKLALYLLTSKFHVYPLFVGEIKDETFFEILINSVCTDPEKLMQCGS